MKERRRERLDKIIERETDTHTQGQKEKVKKSEVKGRSLSNALSHVHLKPSR